MKKLLSLLLVGIMLSTLSVEAKTTKKKVTKTTKKVVTTKKTNTVAADPIADYCTKNGGKTVLKNDSSGNPQGFCKLKDGKEVDQLQYYLENNNTASKVETPKPETKKVEEKAPEQKMIGMPNPASVYCEQQGGKSISKKSEDGSAYGVCQLKDGKEVEEWEYYRQNNSLDTKGTPEKK